MTSPRMTSTTCTASAVRAEPDGKARPSAWWWAREVYKLRDIQRYCKTRIIPQAIPSLNDITEIKVEKILDQVEDSDERQRFEQDGGTSLRRS